MRYPKLYEDFIAAIDLVNLNVGFILSLACVLRTNYHDRLLYGTLGPIMASAALAVIYAFAKRRNHHSPAAMRTVKRKHLSVALFILFLINSSVSRTIFQAFVCDTFDNGVSYLRADYSLTCSTRKHKAFMTYAAVMAIIYPVGIPVTFLYWLFRYQHAIVNQSSHLHQDSDEVEVFRDLWDPYKSDLFYFEILEYARRVVLTGLSVFVYPGSSAQVAIVLLLAVLFASVADVLAPFRKRADAWLYRLGTWTVLLSMYLALLLKVDISKEESRSQTVFAGLLIASHAGLIITAASQPVVWVVDNRTAKIDTLDLPRLSSLTLRSASSYSEGCERCILDTERISS